MKKEVTEVGFFKNRQTNEFYLCTLTHDIILKFDADFILPYYNDAIKKKVNKIFKPLNLKLSSTYDYVRTRFYVTGIVASIGKIEVDNDITVWYR
jgi:hypothetical protein